MSKIKDVFFGGAEAKAGEAAAQAAREGAQVQKEIFGETKEQLLPFIEGGGPAFQKQQALSGALGKEAQAQAFAEFEESPGVAFAREQGIRGIDSTGGVAGGVGGDRLRELTKFSQGLALQDLSSQFNRLGSVTGTGLQAASALGGVGSNAGSGISQALQAGGAAEAAGITGAASGLRSGIQGLGAVAVGLSDVRLKKNIVKVSTLDSGLPWYVWEWTDEAKDIVGDQPAHGVMAHEAAEMFPNAIVMIDGYMGVNYGEIH